MMPIGPLMIEHRVIEHMIKLMEIEMKNIGKNSMPDISFIEDTCDFLKNYVDRCHHGKEENILFKKLRDKDLSGEHKEILSQLINEHKFARRTTSDLVTASQRYKDGPVNDPIDIYKHLRTLTDLYPEHIKKEYKVFFIPSMNYSTDEEKDEKLERFWEFDRNLIHEKNESLVTNYEKTIYKNNKQWPGQF